MSSIWGSFSSFFSGRNPQDPLSYTHPQDRLLNDMDSYFDSINNPPPNPKVQQHFEKVQRLIEENNSGSSGTRGSLFDKTRPFESHTRVTEATQNIAEANLSDPLSGNTPKNPPLSDAPKNLTRYLFGAGMSLLNTAAVTSAAKGFLFFVPMFLYGLYSSKKEYLQNYVLEIDATSKPIIYEVGLGTGLGKSKGRIVKIAFEVESGKPIRYLREKEARRISNFVPNLFSSESFFRKIPFINGLIWDRHEYRTTLVIRVNDPGNPWLEKEPITNFGSFSEKEKFMFFHQDPHQREDYSAYDRVRSARSSDYTRLSSETFKISSPDSSEPHRIENIPLAPRKVLS